MSAYDLVKAVHVTSMVLWIGATLGALGALGAPSPSAALADRLRLLMTTGLIATWLAGLALASLGGWFRFDWLQAKLALVLALTAVQGVIAGRLRRAVAGAPAASGASTAAILATLAAVFAIVVLVLTKPELWSAP